MRLAGRPSGHPPISNHKEPHKPGRTSRAIERTPAATAASGAHRRAGADHERRLAIAWNTSVPAASAPVSARDSHV